MNKVHASLVGMGAGLALALAATAASADGYQRRGLKDAPCCDSWTGFYVGAHGGYAWKDNDFRDHLFVTAGGQNVFMNGVDSRGGLWGFQAGYNWQRGFVVGGLELDFSTASIEGSTTLTNPGFQTVTREDDVKYLGSVRGRLGFTQFGGGCCSNFLVYGTAGLAWEKIHQSRINTIFLPGIFVTQTTTTPEDRFGWVVGIGAEARLGGSGWIARVEYLHYDFGAQHEAVSQVTSQVGAAQFNESPGGQTIEVVRAGLSYKF